MSQKQFSRTVHRDGNSLSVTLPKGWLNQHGIEEGDELYVDPDDGRISFVDE